MEIRKVEKNIANYPKKNEIEKSEIKSATPKKWIFSGMLLSVIDFVGGSVFASETYSHVTLGGPAQEVPGYRLGIYLGITQLILNIVLLVAVLNIIFIKVKSKIKKEECKISKKLKIFTIISFILVVFCVMGRIIYDFWYAGAFDL